MIETATHTHQGISVYSVDPTRTTMLRKAFERAMRKRFNELTRVIRETVYENDAFGLNSDMKMRPFTFQMTPAAADAFAFPRSQDKVKAFSAWLKQQVDKGILEIGEIQQVGVGIEEAWTNKYVFDSYKRGVIRARYELQKAGFGVPGIEQTGGIEISMGTPFHIDRLGLLYTRVFSELKGITAIMDQQISRVLAQGLADGDGPLLLARKLVSTINGTGMGDLALKDTLGRFIPARRRAEIMARTEVIRAHHQATIMEYQNWAVEGIRVKAEWATAQDNRVCSQCAMLEGEIFPLETAMNMIPVHPSCRCIALPYKSADQAAAPFEGIGEAAQQEKGKVFIEAKTIGEAKKWGTFRGINIVNSAKQVQLEDINNVHREIAKIPEKIILRTKKNRGKLDIISNGGITSHPDFAHLKGVRPRGWPEGTTWDDVIGVGGKKSVVVANKLATAKAKASVNLVLHEYGHTVEQHIGYAHNRKVPWESIFNINKSKNLLSRYEAAYSDEYWAESFARYFNSIATRKQLPANVISYFDDFVEMYNL